MTNSTPMDHLKALEALDAGGPATVSLHRIEKAVQWALPLLRPMYENPSEPGVTKAWTPQDHFRTLAKMAGECATPASPPSEALKWIEPFAKAMAYPSNPHVTRHIRALEEDLAQENQSGHPNEIRQASIMWALPILRAYAIRKMTTPPTKNTPGSNVHNLRLLATGESVAWDLVETALDWALPILEASMALPIESIRRATDLELAADELAGNSTPSPAAMSTIRKCMREAASMLRVQTPSNSRYSDQHRQVVSSFLKKASSDPKMPDSAARMYTLAIEIIEAPMSPPSEAQHQINRLSEFMTTYTATHHQAWEVSETPVDVAIRLLSMRSSESMTEHADKLRKIANDLTGNSTKIRDALREAAMILQGLGISFEELAKLESFIEEKFPGELNGNGPATVAIRLLGQGPSRSTILLTEAERDGIKAIIHDRSPIWDESPAIALLKNLLRPLPEQPRPGAKCPCCDRVLLDIQGEMPTALRTWVCSTCYDSGIQCSNPSIRLPTLDASQIPVTRELALEVLRGMLATMQRSYPYAPTPTPEQWATTREALMFLLAYNPEDHSTLFSERKKANEALSKVTGQRNQAWAELREIQGIIGLNLNESPIEAAKRVSSKLKVTLAEAERYQSYWNASTTRLSETMAILRIEAPFPETSKLRSVIEAKWFEKCRPGTMNMMPVRCDACTAPAGTIHLPIPEAQTDGLWAIHSNAVNQRDAAWAELRRIRDKIGAGRVEDIATRLDTMMSEQKTKSDYMAALESEGREIRAMVEAEGNESTPGAVRRAMSAKEQNWESLKKSKDEVSMARKVLGATPEENTAEAAARVMDNLYKCNHEGCQNRQALYCQEHEVKEQIQAWIRSELSDKPKEAEMISFLSTTANDAHMGSRPRREALPKLASAIGWMLKAVFRSSRGLQAFKPESPAADSAQEEMTESESYGWAHQAIRPMVRAQTEIHVREQVLDLVASAVREAWARRRFAEPIKE